MGYARLEQKFPLPRTDLSDCRPNVSAAQFLKVHSLLPPPFAVPHESEVSITRKHIENFRLRQVFVDDERNVEEEYLASPNT